MQPLLKKSGRSGIMFDTNIFNQILDDKIILNSLPKNFIMLPLFRKEKLSRLQTVIEEISCYKFLNKSNKRKYQLKLVCTDGVHMEKGNMEPWVDYILGF